MENNISSSQKMGTMPIGPLLASMAIPAMFSMLIQSMYNVVDSIFVARIGENALTAVSLVFPMQMLVLAFSLGASVGANSLIARRLGEGKREEASAAATNGFFLAGMNYLIFLVAGIFISRPFLVLFSQDAGIVEMGTQYLTIVMVASFGMHIEMMGSKILQATGNMIVPMVSQIIGAVTNIVLDPIMIFGLLGCPAMGVAGAAIATVIGQIFAMIFVLVMYLFKEHDVHVSFKHFRPDGQIVRDIFKVGVPTMIMNAIGSVTTTGMNAILMVYSSTAVAVIGIYFKLQSFVFMPVFGLTQGAMPIMGYNFGANNKKRFMRTMNLSLIVASIIMVIGTAIFCLIPDKLLLLFDASEQMLSIGTVALRTIGFCFIGAAGGIIISTMFQAMGYGFNSLLMSLLRQLVLILPIGWLFGKLWGLDGVWFAYPTAEYICLLVFLPIAVSVVRKEFHKKEEQAVSGPQSEA